MKINYCNICPRKCETPKNNKFSGYCKTENGYFISSIFAHRGEEPPISSNKGICNVFFAHCNLQCVYCQNYEISDNKTPLKLFKMSLNTVISKISSILDTGINILGFVSPSHFVPQTIKIIQELHKKKYFPTIVYNTNAYDKISTLKKLEKYVDIYLPDLKYALNSLAKKYSDAYDYPKIAFAALKEMYRQKGSTLIINKNGYAESGLIIRHLVLPGNIENSIKILRFIANELSTKVHISLMSQYYPAYKAFDYPELSKTLTKKEYQKAIEEMKKLNLTNGWIQALESHINYRPNFKSDKPFYE